MAVWELIKYLSFLGIKALLLSQHGASALMAMNLLQLSLVIGEQLLSTAQNGGTSFESCFMWLSGNK